MVSLFSSVSLTDLAATQHTHALHNGVPSIARQAIALQSLGGGAPGPIISDPGPDKPQKDHQAGQEQDFN